MYKYQFPMLAATATIVLYHVDASDNIRYVIGKRHEKSCAFPEYWGLVGGFLDAKSETQKGETLEQCAVRETKEESGLQISESALKFFRIDSNPDLDPRSHNISVSYICEIHSWQLSKLEAGDDLSQIKLMSFQEASKLDLAFNHNDVLEHGHQIIRNLVESNRKVADTLYYS